jgi:hypothetical protein
MCLSVKSIFLDKYIIVINNIEEQIKKLTEKHNKINGNINLTDKPDTQDNTQYNTQDNTQSNTTTVDEKDMHTTEPETTETLDIYTTIDNNTDKPITTDNDNHTTTRVQEQPEFEPKHIL